MSNMIKRTEYPSDGTVVERIIDNGDGTLTIVYEDNTYLVVRKVGVK